LETAISSQIFLSRDQIRSQIIEYFQTYLDLRNVDLLKSSYMSFMINILATLTSNILFYQISAYREFFLTTAQLPESILNLATFLGYNTEEASYSIANALMTIPFGFEDSITITIPSGFKFYAGQVEFITDYVTTITVTNNQNATVLVQDGQKIYNLPVSIDTTVTNSFSFVLSVKQYKSYQQEFQIDQDLDFYQFITIDIPLTGKISSLIIEVQEPGSSSWVVYTEFSSLYLMSTLDKGFVSRKTSEGRRLYFGNGVIGVQPTPGSTIRATINETLGESGNVIAGSINKGDRIYTTTQAGVTKVLNYSVINASPTTGGADEESLDEIRSNAIASLTALGRLVSESDYKNANVVLPNSPVAENSLPVLKRSDLKVNEIQLYSTLFFGDSPVPTRNAKYLISQLTSYIPRNTIVEVDSVDYYTLFDMTIDYINKVANYQYIMYETEQVPLLVRSYGQTYNISATRLLTTKEENTAVLNLYYYTDESDSTSCECEIMFAESGKKYEMTNDYSNSRFTYTFDPYTEIPEGALNVYFTISRSGTLIAQYSVSLTFRRSLDDFMMSNMVVGDSTTFVEIDSTSAMVFDIPVIKKSYYDSIDKRTFESQILQSILSGTDFAAKRMLTDFTNIKLTNTTGLLKNMQLNETNKFPVIDINVEAVPLFASLGDRFIISGVEGGSWEGQPRGSIAECINEVLQTWAFSTPVIDNTIYVENKEKKYIFSEGEWRVPEYQLPLEIELEVFKSSSYTGSDIELSNAIKDSLITAFGSRFGTNISIYRSEIIDVVQEVTGVGHCRLVKPETSIYYNFDLDELTQRELLEYGPEYIYFATENISIWVL